MCETVLSVKIFLVTYSFSEGWLDIVSSWLEQGPKVTRSLSLIASNSPGLVSGCVSLYGENLR